MFESAKSDLFTSSSGRPGAHYNVFSSETIKGMEALRAIFPEGAADAMNLCVFSTSGVHGDYSTIEEVENWVLRQIPTHSEPGDDPWGPSDLTFLIIHPRLVCLRYGLCEPKTEDDFHFLRLLRLTSWEWFIRIGRSEFK